MPTVGQAINRATSVRGAQSDSSHFQVPERYRFQRSLGSGSYGVVAAFYDSCRGRNVAIKRIRRAFDNFLVLRRTLREVRLMRHFRHPNLLRLYKVLPVDQATGDLYITLELMDCDLETLMHTRHFILRDEQCRRFCVQMLLGLLNLHYGHVIHRDLKPANIFVRTSDGQVKIGDLGLSRGIAVDGSTGEACHPSEEQLTEYVVTRWYRAPEVLLARSKYGPPVDVWAVGCILYEMWARKALFPGKNSFDQLKKTLAIVGTPPNEELKWVPPESMTLFQRSCPPKGRSDGELEAMVKALSSPETTKTRKSSHDVRKMLSTSTVGQDAADILRQMCRLDPARRATAEQALRHPYLAPWTTEEDMLFAKAAYPADVSYDSIFDGIGQDGEPAAILQLGRFLRREAVRDQPVDSDGYDAGTRSSCRIGRSDSCRSRGVRGTAYAHTPEMTAIPFNAAAAAVASAPARSTCTPPVAEIFGKHFDKILSSRQLGAKIRHCEAPSARLSSDIGAKANLRHSAVATPCRQRASIDSSRSRSSSATPRRRQELGNQSAGSTPYRGTDMRVSVPLRVRKNPDQIGFSCSTSIGPMANYVGSQDPRQVTPRRRGPLMPEKRWNGTQDIAEIPRWFNSMLARESSRTQMPWCDRHSRHTTPLGGFTNSFPRPSPSIANQPAAANEQQQPAHCTAVGFNSRPRSQGTLAAHQREHVISLGGTSLSAEFGCTNAAPSPPTAPREMEGFPSEHVAVPAGVPFRSAGNRRW